MSMNRNNNTSPPFSTSTPTQNQSSNQTSENQDDNQWPRFLIMEAADKKNTTQLKCIRAEKSNRWNGKCWPWQWQTHEIRQRLYWSRNKTAMQKSLEDNQAPGLFTCESVATQNPRFIKICHQMRGTGQDGRRNQKRTSATRNHCCQKNLHTIQTLFSPSKDKLFQKGSILDIWKKKHHCTFPTLKDVFNARNLDIPRTHVKVKLFVLDVVK